MKSSVYWAHLREIRDGGWTFLLFLVHLTWNDPFGSSKKYVIAFEKLQSSQYISYINSQCIRAGLILCSKITTKYC